MNAAQTHRHFALLKSAGFEDAAPLSISATHGDIPHGRELSFAWLTGTVLTGLTSVVLMGAALYVSFQGQDTFSTAVDALPPREIAAPATSLLEKTARIKPVTLTRSEREIVEASIREDAEGRGLIRQQQFVRVRATLATSITALSANVPAYDPVSLLNAVQPAPADSTSVVSTNIYGTNVEGEVAVRSLPLDLGKPPAPVITDAQAADYVRQQFETTIGGADDAVYLAYASTNSSIRDLGIESNSGLAGVAENVTVVPKSFDGAAAAARTERIVTIREAETLETALTKNGFTPAMISAISATLRNVFPVTDLPANTHLRILLGPSRLPDSVIPYRLSIYVGERHAATVALTDAGRYVIALPPPEIVFPEEDTEQVDVNNLPSIYRSIWETGRKHDLSDDSIERIVLMYAYDLDLKKKITPGDSIELLESPPDSAGNQELLYVALTLGNSKREFFRYRSSKGVTDFYDPDGQTGKRFLTRRPLQGGGTRISSPFGYRKHPIYGTYKLHTGVDLSAKYGTPIYAAGDGVIEKASWVSGYGRFVRIKHVNGYETGYGHMSRIADGMAPGVRVRQGQIVGYVGSTGVSTGNHLHFEIKINGRFVDPLSVKLPRDRSLPASEGRAFKKSVAQIRDLIKLDPTPVTVASAD